MAKQLVWRDARMLKDTFSQPTWAECTNCGERARYMPDAPTGWCRSARGWMHACPVPAPGDPVESSSSSPSAAEPKEELRVGVGGNRVVTKRECEVLLDIARACLSWSRCRLVVALPETLRRVEQRIEVALEGLREVRSERAERVIEADDEDDGFEYDPARTAPHPPDALSARKAARIEAILLEWQKGCSVSDHAPSSSPAECHECTKAMVDAVAAVADGEIVQTPRYAAEPILRVCCGGIIGSPHAPDCREASTLGGRP